jgi:hypothetical protein
MPTVTYKGDKVAGRQIQITLNMDDSGNLQVEGSTVMFWPSRFLGGNDGRVDLNPTIIQAAQVDQEAIANLDAALVSMFSDPDHLKILSSDPRLQGEPLQVDGVDFVIPVPEPEPAPEPTE